MRTSLPRLCAFVCLAATAAAQHAILYTGRFPFVSLDRVHERTGGAITGMSEYDFSYCVPMPGGSVGRTLMPATAMHSYLGDGDGDGDYLKLRSWKTSPFSRIGIDGVFLKHGVAAPTWQDVYWTPRLDAGFDMEVLTNGGTPVTLAEGDWLRLLPNGEVEFFMTRAQFAVAVGSQVGPPFGANPAAGALAQSATGDLYYGPAEGGHFVNSWWIGHEYAHDGAIVKIDANNITYDAAGNVSGLAPNSARLLINEVVETVAGPTVRDMVVNSGAQSRNGIAMSGNYLGRISGLGFDPNGGTWTPTYVDSTGSYPPEPNLVFSGDNAAPAGTIWTTNNGGQVAMVNGVPCGSTTAGVPADGAWLGVEFDLGNFQPTLLGMTIVDVPTQQMIADQGDYGSLPDDTTQPIWHVDFYGAANQPVFGLMALGPQPPTLVVPALDPAIIGLPFTADTWQHLFLTSSPLGMGLAVTDGFGYATISLPNPNPGGFTGFTIMVQGLGLVPGSFQLSSPLLVQLQ